MSFAILQNYFYKEVNPGNVIAAYYNYLQKFKYQNLIQTCIKLLITFHWFSNTKKNEETNLFFAFEQEFLITYNSDKFWNNPKFWLYFDL